MFVHICICIVTVVILSIDIPITIILSNSSSSGAYQAMAPKLEVESIAQLASELHVASQNMPKHPAASQPDSQRSQEQVTAWGPLSSPPFGTPKIATSRT